jgi:GntR family transcriptional regulator, transcriptional repressor for pyruvate dehydrogenase complex
VADDVDADRDASVSRRRPTRVAEDIRLWMVAQGFRSGDRLPGAAEFAARFGMARGTIRAALAILEAQGLVETRMGADAGLHVGSFTGARAEVLLGSYLLLNDPDVSDIYQIRRLLEPDLVAGLAGRLPGPLLDDLEAQVLRDADAEGCLDPCDRQVAALAFHARLAREAGNPILGLLVACLARLLSEMAVAGAAPVLQESAVRQRGEDYRMRLIHALREGRAGDARRVMLDHLETALHLSDLGPAPHRLIAE